MLKLCVCVSVFMHIAEEASDLTLQNILCVKTKNETFFCLTDKLIKSLIYLSWFLLGMLEKITVKQDRASWESDEAQKQCRWSAEIKSSSNRRCQREEKLRRSTYFVLNWGAVVRTALSIQTRNKVETVTPVALASDNQKAVMEFQRLQLKCC